MSRYIPPGGGPTRVDPGDLTPRQRRALRRLARRPQRPTARKTMRGDADRTSPRTLDPPGLAEHDTDR